MFRIKYINKDVIDTAHGVSGVLGNAFHCAVDVFFKSEKNEVAEGLKAGLMFIEEYPEGFIRFSKSIPDKQHMSQKLAFMYNNRVVELEKNEKVVGTELLIEEFIDVDWKGNKVVLPVKLKGYLDKLERDDEKRLVITDEKTCHSFSDPEKIDGRKILQCIQYYFLAYAQTGEEPYKFIFVENKHSKSRDGVQIKRYEIIYSENTLFFDFYLRFYGDVLKALMGEQVFLPNIDTFIDNEVGIISYIHRLDEPDQKAKLEKLHKVTSITEVLKKKMVSAKNMKSFENSVKKSLVEYKNIDYSKMANQDKISTKLMEHGLVLHFDSSIEGLSFVQYRFTPSIGVKMKTLKNYSADIEQALGVSGIRIVAPIPNTTFIGIEVPKKERSFVKLTKSSIGLKDEGLPIGIEQDGEVIRMTLDEFPHLLVAGTTGSGKSYFLNSIIKSLIGQDKDTSLYLVDPKMVEFSSFERKVKKIAYDQTEACNILSSLVTEMDSRYKTIRKNKVRSYKDCGLNNIVCVIDEFADLIMASSITRKKKPLKKGDKNIEEEPIIENLENLIIRIAQKGRAAGIHLIIATQRPDAKVITGLIKANFPTKIAFYVNSELNSRIILDEAGAEKLLGKGDGLMSSSKFAGLKRFQAYSLE